MNYTDSDIATYHQQTRQTSELDDIEERALRSIPFAWMICQVGFPDRYQKWLKKHEKESKRYRYFLTFTLDRKKQRFSRTEDFYTEVQTYVENLAFSAQFEALSWVVVREHHKDGTPHWHVSVESKRCIKKSFFRYYERIFGLINISKSRENGVEFAINYMQKENDPVSIL